jgi:aromatic-L-amino-acid decarboxylase
VELAERFASWVDEDERFELAVPRSLNLVCFRFRGSDEENERLLERLNATGALYLTHTKLGDRYVLRMSIGQTWTEEKHVRAAWDRIREVAGGLSG